MYPYIKLNQAANVQISFEMRMTDERNQIEREMHVERRESGKPFPRRDAFSVGELRYAGPALHP